MSQFHKMTTTAQAMKPLWCICLQNAVGLCTVIQVLWVSDTVFKTLWVSGHYLSTIVGLWTLVQTLWICGHFCSNIVGLWTFLFNHCGFVVSVAQALWVVDTAVQILWVCGHHCSNSASLWTLSLKHCGFVDTVAQTSWVWGHYRSNSVDLWTLLFKHCGSVNTVVQTLWVCEHCYSNIVGLWTQSPQWLCPLSLFNETAKWGRQQLPVLIYALHSGGDSGLPGCPIPRSAWGFLSAKKNG